MLKSKRILSVISCILICVVLFNCMQFCTFAQEETDETINIAEANEKILSDTYSSYNKIHFYFNNLDHTTIDNMAELDQAVTDLKSMKSELSVCSTTNSSDSEMNIKITIQFESDFMETSEYKAFAQERNDLDSMDKVREFRSRLNTFSKEYHEQIINENRATISAFDYIESEAIAYSPFIVLTVDPNTIDVPTLFTIAEADNIAHISVANEAQAMTEELEEVANEASWKNTLKAIKADEIVSNDSYTGEGIYIGIYEVGGVCDISKTWLSDNDITLQDSTSPVDSHADNVASILTTMAPKAKFFVGTSPGTGIAWFIEQGCDIVNCSWGYTYNVENDDDTYTEGIFQYRYDADGIFDYQILAHFVTVVKSAGNVVTNNEKSSYNPTGKITSPGYAYNVITVGGVNRNLLGEIKYEEDACYKSSLPEAKPNISAMFTVTIPNCGIGSGTSYAAPQVAGCIALLMESKPAYIAFPERILSVITSTAQKTDDYVADIDNFDSRVGAGIVNLEKMIESTIYDNIWHDPGSTYNSNIYCFELDLEAGTELQVAITWLVTPVVDSSNNITDILCTDYDLKILDPDYDILQYSLLISSNVEFLRLTTEKNGTYRIYIYQNARENDIEEECISLTYNY